MASFISRLIRFLTPNSDPLREDIANQPSNNQTVQLSGIIAISDMPPHLGLIVRLALHPVFNSDDAPPGDDAFPEESTEVYNSVDLNIELAQPFIEIPYVINCTASHVYIQLSTIMFRQKGEKAFAQVERFTFAKRSLPLFEDMRSVTLPVTWPQIPLEELGSYGTVYPTGR